MATGLWGSICLNDLIETCQIATAPDGSVWMNLSNLPKDKFQKSNTNGKTYINLAFWIQDELDEHGNAANIAWNISKEERERGVKAKSLGRFKYMAAKPQPGFQQAQAPAATNSTPWGGTPAPAQGFGQAPAPQQNTGFGAPPPANQNQPFGQPQQAPAPGGNPWSGGGQTGGLPF